MTFYAKVAHAKLQNYQVTKSAHFWGKKIIKPKQIFFESLEENAIGEGDKIRVLIIIPRHNTEIFIFKI